MRRCENYARKKIRKSTDVAIILKEWWKWKVYASKNWNRGSFAYFFGSCFCTCFTKPLRHYCSELGAGIIISISKAVWHRWLAGASTEYAQTFNRNKTKFYVGGVWWGVSTISRVKKWAEAYVIVFQFLKTFSRLWIQMVAFLDVSKPRIAFIIILELKVQSRWTGTPKGENFYKLWSNLVGS